MRSGTGLFLQAIWGVTVLHLEAHNQWEVAHRLVYHSTLGSRVIKKKKGSGTGLFLLAVRGVEVLHRAAHNYALGR